RGRALGARGSGPRRLHRVGRQHRRVEACDNPRRRDAFVTGYARTDGGTIGERLRMRVLDVVGELEGETGDRQEILYVLTGSGTLELDGESHELGPDAGVLLLPGEEYAIVGDVRVVAVDAPAEGEIAASWSCRGSMTARRSAPTPSGPSACCIKAS